ncbi:MAG: hypothetical protein GY820_13350, partial [Gammaproteobacteria bacterium]|nr:hypothetical protein [Gammaproteobacteria bacterium]
MQCERQLRDSNEQLSVAADKCNRPMVHTAKVHSARLHDACSQRLVNPVNRKLIECCDRQNARKGSCQDHHRVDYSYSNPPNSDCCAEKQRTGKELAVGSELANDSPIVAIKQLRRILDGFFAESANNYAKSNKKMEKIVTDVRELSEVVDHDIMKRDQESNRFNRQLLESEKTTDRFKNETPILSEFNRSLMESEKTTDKFKKDEPALNVFMAARHELRSTSEGLVMEPYVEALPIQCVPVAKLT